MTKEEAEAKLSVIPLTSPVAVNYDVFDDEPYLTFSYTPPNSGPATISIPVQPSFTHLTNLAANLPMATGDRLAAAALLVTPALPGGV